MKAKLNQPRGDDDQNKVAAVAYAHPDQDSKVVPGETVVRDSPVDHSSLGIGPDPSLGPDRDLVSPAPLDAPSDSAPETALGLSFDNRQPPVYVLLIKQSLFAGFKVP
jgi:hypothetical protein